MHNRFTYSHVDNRLLTFKDKTQNWILDKRKSRGESIILGIQKYQPANIANTAPILNT